MVIFTYSFLSKIQKGFPFGKSNHRQRFLVVTNITSKPSFRKKRDNLFRQALMKKNPVYGSPKPETCTFVL